MRCDEITEDLAGVTDGAVELDTPARHHVDQCLRCQAELAQYRKLVRALHALRSEVFDPGTDLLADVLATIEAAGDRHAARGRLTSRRVAYLGGLAAATAAGAAGALLLSARVRRLRPAV